MAPGPHWGAVPQTPIYGSRGGRRWGRRRQKGPREVRKRTSRKSWKGPREALKGPSRSCAERSPPHRNQKGPGKAGKCPPRYHKGQRESRRDARQVCPHGYALDRAIYYSLRDCARPQKSRTALGGGGAKNFFCLRGFFVLS